MGRLFCIFPIFFIYVKVRSIFVQALLLIYFFSFRIYSILKSAQLDLSVLHSQEENVNAVKKILPRSEISAACKFKQKQVL